MLCNFFLCIFVDSEISVCLLYLNVVEMRQQERMDRVGNGEVYRRCGVDVRIDGTECGEEGRAEGI